MIAVYIPWEEFSKSIFKFSYLLIRGLIKGLIPNYAIFSTFSTDIYHYVVHYGITPQGKHSEHFHIFTPVNKDIN